MRRTDKHRRPFSFTDLDNVSIKRKSLMPMLVTGIIGGTLLLVVLIFLGLFLAEAPMTINNVMYDYGDEPYMRFYLWFFVITGLFIVVSVITGYMFSLRYKHYLIIGRDAYANVYVCVTEKKKAYYITEDYLITYDKASGFADKTKDPVVLRRNKLIYLIFDYPANDIRITDKKNSRKIKFSVDDYVYQYTFPGYSLRNLSHYRRSISKRTKNQYQFQHLSVYRIEKRYTSSQKDIPREILNLIE